MAKSLKEETEIPDSQQGEKTLFDADTESKDPSMDRKINPGVQTLVGSLSQPISRLDNLRQILESQDLSIEDLAQLIQTPKAIRATDLTQVFTVTVDGILRPDGQGEWQGRVSRGDLEAGGANVDWLIQSGAIIDEGFIRSGG